MLSKYSEQILRDYKGQRIYQAHNKLRLFSTAGPVKFVAIHKPGHFPKAGGETETFLLFQSRDSLRVQ